METQLPRKHVESGCELELEYTLSTEDTVIDSTERTGPLRVRLGEGRLHPVIEQRLIGLAEGADFHFTLAPSLAFGERNEELLSRVARDKLPPNFANVEVGAHFEAPGPDKKPRIFRVVEVTPNAISIDGNHPLAGHDIDVEGRVLKIL